MAEAFIENILAKQRQFKILIHTEQIAKSGIKRRSARQKFIYRVVKTGKLTAGLLEADLGAQLIVADIKCLLYQPRKSSLWRMGGPLAREVRAAFFFRKEEAVIFGIKQAYATLDKPATLRCPSKLRLDAVNACLACVEQSCCTTDKGENLLVLIIAQETGDVQLKRAVKKLQLRTYFI